MRETELKKEESLNNINKLLKTGGRIKNTSGIIGEA
jgi:hypothetical protein